jgi:AcrR family transcriptional regulator
MARKTGSHSEITGPRIRAAAERLFARRGFAAVSMRAIAAEVGVQAGALYLYTPDKEHLLFEMMRAHLEELHAAWAAEAARLPADPRARLAGFARFHIRFHLERRDAVFIAYMELRSLSAGHFARIEGLRRDYEGELAAILAAGAAAGVFARRDVMVGARAIIAMLTGVVNWYRPDGPLGQAALADAYAAMALGAAGAVDPIEGAPAPRGGGAPAT